MGLGAVLAFAGILLTAILTIRRVRGALLLGILAACAEPQPASAVSARVDELQENNFSVYSAANLCSLLEKAGAIERVTAEGEPAEDIEVEPQTVVVDGVEYLVIEPERWSPRRRTAVEAALDNESALEADNAR